MRELEGKRLRVGEREEDAAMGLLRPRRILPRVLPWGELMEGKKILEGIKRRVEGKMSDTEWVEFQRKIEEKESGTLKCKVCKDQGYVFTKNKDGAEFLYRCQCEKGKALPDIFFRDSEKAPIPLKVWREEVKKDWQRQPGEWDE